MPKSFRTVEITQQVSYGWSPENVQKCLDGWSVVKDYAYILHDKDTRDDGSLKESHTHTMVRFNTPVPTSAIIAHINGVLGMEVIKENQLERCKKWSSAIAYLTHENVSGKHVYDRKEVVSNFDFEKEIETVLRDSDKLNIAVSGIVNGNIKPYSIPDYIEPDIYVKYKNKIEAAFDYRAKMLLQKGDRDMECIYVQGDSGVGKTTFAKQICENRHMSYFVSSGSNDVLDGYGGQDCIILDDLRPSCLSLSDLLKMLDNNTGSTVKSRYRNKVLECKLIIITTTKDVDTFFNEVFENENETRVQLKRRCKTLIKMSSDRIVFYAYSERTKEYMVLSETPNVVLDKYRVDSMSTEQKLDYVAELIGASGDMVQALKKGMHDGDFVTVSDEELPYK